VEIISPSNRIAKQDLQVFSQRNRPCVYILKSQGMEQGELGSSHTGVCCVLTPLFRGWKHEVGKQKKGFQCYSDGQRLLCDDLSLKCRCI